VIHGPSIFIVKSGPTSYEHRVGIECQFSRYLDIDEDAAEFLSS
jgi:hypothetical protein